MKNSNLSTCVNRTSLSEAVSVRSTFSQGDSMARTLLGLVTIAMTRSSLWLRPAAYAVLVMLLAMPYGSAFGQGMGGGGGNTGGGGGGGGAAGGRGGGMTAAGIVIDANGVLRTQTVAGAGLTAERLKAAVASLPADLQTKSPLRKVALSRLEAEVAKAAATGRGIPDELAKLAGLTRVQYVFIYPADGSGQDAAPGDERGDEAIEGSRLACLFSTGLSGPRKLLAAASGPATVRPPSAVGGPSGLPGEPPTARHTHRPHQALTQGVSHT